MCGIAGFLDYKRKQGRDGLIRIVTKMSDTMKRRGPDDSGSWCDENVSIALGHRRLSIIELSACGHQPMVSGNGRYVITYNGEVYNFKSIRQELEKKGQTFRGNSDTEVVLQAIEAWGVEAAVKQFVGMFAFAVWDRQERVLTLARDRIGIKPLYYGYLNGIFLFASELKALRAFPDLNFEVNREALAAYLRYNNVPCPFSIYKNIFKLPQGTILSVGLKDANNDYSPQAFWSAKAAVEQGMRSSFSGTVDEAVSSLEGLLAEAVGLRTISDVPLGAFMSGGIDSASVVALMQRQSARPINTFTIGFREPGYNEAENARIVSKYLGTRHTEMYVSPQEALSVIPELSLIYDEPFSDSSQIPTYLISKLTRQFVTVALSGDGGDELFAGYNRYSWAKKIWKKVSWAPKIVRHTLAANIGRIPPRKWEAILGSILPGNIRPSDPGNKMHKLAQVLKADRAQEIYLWLVSHWKYPQSVLEDGIEPVTIAADPSKWVETKDFRQQMMYLDLVSYLPDDILVKVDRASMAVSLEARVPLLDHRVVEFAWRLPVAMKMYKGQTKYILRRILFKYVPEEFFKRPKMGFSIPLGDWLRGPLRGWAESLLNPRRIKEEGFFKPEAVSDKWKEHLSAKSNCQDYLWPVLMFEAWHDRWKN